ncbi:MAG: LytR/AlgR family response regulator transcription factor [Floccifex sp.]
MMRIVVADDDKIILDYICKVINEVIQEEIILNAFDDSTVFFQNINKLMPDIVFLDIDMPKLNGFDLAETLKCIKPNVTIIFISNLEHLVFQSFEFKPFRFVRKSHLDEDLLSAIKAYKNELNKARDIYIFKTNDCKRSVPTSDIVYFESMGHDVYIQTTNDKHKLKRERENEISIKMISEQFETKGFIRVHRSYLVNYRYIYMINRNNVILKNNAEIGINPHKVNEIKNVYQNFLMMEV